MKHAWLASLLLLALPAGAQDWDVWDPITVRDREHTLLVYDGDTYYRITFEQLLAGLVEFDDGAVRHIALIPADPNDDVRPAITAATFTGGVSITGQRIGAAFPDLPDDAAAAWLAIAVKDPPGLPYLAAGLSNLGNLATIMEPLTGTLTIDGESGFSVWASFVPQNRFFFGSGYLYFSLRAAPPTP